jgi:outer membrane lipoprotein-sorting protein|tara:strand:+ start:4939 stop:5343 length:405 start_codon:yes stop_codon:yes gene_type:complete
MKNILISVLATVSVVLALAVMGLFSDRQFQAGSSAVAPVYGSISSASITMTSTTAQLASASSGRLYLKCTNHGTESVFVGLDEVVAVDEGFVLEPSKSFEITPENLYTGIVSGITNGTSVSTHCIERDVRDSNR